MRWSRVLTVWVALVCAEIIHGILRTLLLAPRVGDFRARQIGVFTGSLLILLIAGLSIRWIHTRSMTSLVKVGVVWLVLMVVFELAFGRLVLGASWERLWSDFNLLEGGLLPVGLAVLALSPLIAARLRGVQRESAAT